MNFRAVFEAAEELLRKAKKKCGDTEKNKEKLEANCTGFSAEFFGSQSVEMFCFARKTKNSNVDSFLQEPNISSGLLS